MDKRQDFCQGLYGILCRSTKFNRVNPRDGPVRVFCIHSFLQDGIFYHDNMIYCLNAIQLTVLSVFSILRWHCYSDNSSLLRYMWVVKKVRGDLTFSALWKSTYYKCGNVLKITVLLLTFMVTPETYTTSHRMCMCM